MLRAEGLPVPARAMSGILYLVPATLGDLKTAQDADLLQASLPPAVHARIAALTVYAVENAKTARAFLKACGTTLPLQGIEMVEIGHTPEDAMFKPLLQKLAQGVDVGVLSEAGCPGIADPGSQLARGLAHARWCAGGAAGGALIDSAGADGLRPGRPAFCVSCRICR